MKYSICYFLSLLLSPLIAFGGENFVITQTVNPALGKYKFEFVRVGPQSNTVAAECPVREPNIDTEIVITDSKGKVIQRLPVNFLVFQCRGGVSFADLNDDGYADLLIANFATVGPYTNSDVYVFDPKQRKFKQSQELSGWGNYQKQKQKGCVLVEMKPPTDDYIEETFCFSKVNRKFHRVIDYATQEQLRN